MLERSLPFLLLISLGVVAYQQIKLGAYPPPPSAFVGVAMVYSLLAFLALASPQLAAAFGLGIVIWLALAYQGGLTKSTAKTSSPQGGAAR